MIEAARFDRVLVDTGPLVAVLHADEQHHRVCVETLARIRPPLLTCWPVLTEAAWLLRHSTEQLKRIYRGVDEGLFSILPLEEQALAVMGRSFSRHSQLRPQLADLSLLCLAETHQIKTLFTLDRRDFAAIHQRRHLHLLPETIA